MSAEVLEGPSGEDEVEDETFGRIFPRSRTRRGEEFFPFPRPFRGRDEEFLGISAFFSAILRTRLLILVFRGQGRDEARNFAPFLVHFEVETRPSRTSEDSDQTNFCDVEDTGMKIVLNTTGLQPPLASSSNLSVRLRIE